MSVRHPEKINKPSNPIQRKPSWIRVKISNSSIYNNTKKIVNDNKLHTVCEEAGCPNISECWSKKHATFMIMGDTCTRACSFCNVKTGIPNSLNSSEPDRVALATKQLDLSHVVITSVDRDDLDDGGAEHFATTVKKVRELNPDTTIEILTPDFLRKGESYKIVADSEPDVFNHNIETVPSNYIKVRPGSRYFHSINLLKQVKDYKKNMFTKSGLMVGLGETKEELYQVMDDLRCANVDFLTIGQYLQPTDKHHPIKKFVEPKEFEDYSKVAYSKGFLLVSSSPMTRSSYHAGDDFKVLREKRLNNQI